MQAVSKHQAVIVIAMLVILLILTNHHQPVPSIIHLGEPPATKRGLAGRQFFRPTEARYRTRKLQARPIPADEMEVSAEGMEESHGISRLNHGFG